MTTQMKPGVTSFDTPNDTQLVVTRVASAPRKAVFECWTNPKYLPQWMLGPPGWTMPVCEIDLRPGGTWHYVWRKDDGSEMAMTGTVKEVKAPERLVTTERWGPEWPETVNTVQLVEAAGRTTITITVLYPSKEARDMALQTGMKAGMNAGFARLDELLGQLA